MNVFKRGIIFVTFFGCCFGMALMAAALGTEFWFQSEAIQKDKTKNFTELRTEAHGKLNFGLFTGNKMLNWGIGDRSTEFKVDVDTVPKFMNEGLWLATIALLCSALLFAVVGAIFAIINTASTPIEFITGVPGLYVWNGCAALFALLCVICWGVEFRLFLTSNILVDDKDDGWTTEGLEHLGYSFWLVVVSVAMHVANCILIFIGTFERKIKTQYEAPETKSGNILLY